MKQSASIKAFAELRKLLGPDSKACMGSSAQNDPDFGRSEMVSMPLEKSSEPRLKQGTAKTKGKKLNAVRRNLQRALPPQKNGNGHVLPKSNFACPLCKEPVRELDVHCQLVHPAEWSRLKALERSMLTGKNVRPVIFLGGSPGSGKRR